MEGECDRSSSFVYVWCMLVWCLRGHSAACTITIAIIVAVVVGIECGYAGEQCTCDRPYVVSNEHYEVFVYRVREAMGSRVAVVRG